MEETCSSAVPPVFFGRHVQWHHWTLFSWHRSVSSLPRNANADLFSILFVEPLVVPALRLSLRLNEDDDGASLASTAVLPKGDTTGTGPNEKLDLMRKRNASKEEHT